MNYNSMNMFQSGNRSISQDYICFRKSITNTQTPQQSQRQFFQPEKQKVIYTQQQELINDKYQRNPQDRQRYSITNFTCRSLEKEQIKKTNRIDNHHNQIFNYNKQQYKNIENRDYQLKKQQLFIEKQKEQLQKFREYNQKSQKIRQSGKKTLNSNSNHEFIQIRDENMKESKSDKELLQFLNPQNLTNYINKYNKYTKKSSNQGLLDTNQQKRNSSQQQQHNSPKSGKYEEYKKLQEKLNQLEDKIMSIKSTMNHKKKNLSQEFNQFEKNTDLRSKQNYDHQNQNKIDYMNSPKYGKQRVISFDFMNKQGHREMGNKNIGKKVNYDKMKNANNDDIIIANQLKQDYSTTGNFIGNINANINFYNTRNNFFINTDDQNPLKDNREAKSSQKQKITDFVTQVNIPFKITKSPKTSLQSEKLNQKFQEYQYQQNQQHQQFNTRNSDTEFQFENYYVNPMRRAIQKEKKQQQMDYFDNIFREHLNQNYQALNFVAQIDQSQQKLQEQLHYKSILLEQKDYFKNKKTLIFDLDETLIHCNDNQFVSSDLNVGIEFPTGEKIQVRFMQLHL